MDARVAWAGCIFAYGGVYLEHLVLQGPEQAVENET